MNAFPFPKLLAFLKEEKDQIEFMKIAAEVGLGNSDLELAKLLLALQIYASIYARTPREIKAVHADALAEIRHLRDEVEFLANRAACDTQKVTQWAEQMHSALRAVEPKQLANLLHKRLLDDTLAALGGSLQMLATAYGKVDVASQKMNDAAHLASEAIAVWQDLTLRRVWLSAFCICLVVAGLTLTGLWFLYLRHAPWWLALQH